jgi:hypothetical protein
MQTSFAQATPFQVVNNTECHFLVKAIASDTTCDSACTSKLICMPPQSVVNINGCSSDSTQVWAQLCVTPAEDARCKLCPDVITSCVSPSNMSHCSGAPIAIYDEEACGACSNYSGQFLSPTIFEITN